MQPGNYLFDRRRDFLLSFLPEVKHLCLEIAKQQEDLQLVYESELLDMSFPELLTGSRQKDCILQRTTTGIHRDNIDIILGNQPFRSIASQGQRKSLLFALKLAEMQVLQQEKGFPPLLLLDDVFEKLDEDRISNLLRKVCIENEGQVFITDTHADRLQNHLDSLSTPYQLIDI